MPTDSNTAVVKGVWSDTLTVGKLVYTNGSGEIIDIPPPEKLSVEIVGNRIDHVAILANQHGSRVFDGKPHPLVKPIWGHLADFCEYDRAHVKEVVEYMLHNYPAETLDALYDTDLPIPPQKQRLSSETLLTVCDNCIFHNSKRCNRCTTDDLQYIDRRSIN